MSIFHSMQSGTLIEIIGAHDCLSARIGLAAGFDAVWASSLGLSTVAGRRDRNELSWTELVDAAGEIAQTVDAPVILDANEGYGHDETARLITVRAKQRGLYGLCVEDKRFPKLNSHEPGVELTACKDAARRITICREAGCGDDFFIVGRTDALVVGETISEAIKRAEAYRAAGASAIVVHSKAKSFAELRAFMQAWSGSCPVIVIPTTFGGTPRADYINFGVGGIIWANQLIRSTICSMTLAASRLRIEGSSVAIEEHLAPIETAFTLAGPGWRESARSGDVV